MKYERTIAVLHGAPRKRRLGVDRVMVDGVGDQRSPEGEAPGSPE